MLFSPVTSCNTFSTNFKSLDISYLALNIAGSVGVTAAIRRKFLPATLDKPIDRPIVSDEKLFAVSFPATKFVDTNTNPPVRKQIIVRFLFVVVLKGEKFRC